MIGKWAFNVTVNGLAASPLVPRPARALLYRLAGLRVSCWRFGQGCYFGDSNITIGARTFVNHGCFFDTSAAVTIGDRCHLAQAVMVLTSSHTLDKQHALQAMPVVIGADCWLGARSMVLPGVSVAERCVVAAGAVVAHDTEPGGLYAGVPARRVRDLDSADERGAVELQRLPVHVPVELRGRRQRHAG